MKKSSRQITAYKKRQELPLRSSLAELRKLGYDRHFRKLGMTVPEYIAWVRGTDEESENAEG